MKFFEKLVGILTKKDLITCSNITTVSTKYGLFKIKAYKKDDREYLAIMSRNFYELKDPIVYIHSNFHIHNDPNSNIRYSNNGISSILKMIYKVGGLIIYPSKDGKSIDELLQELNARKLENQKNSIYKEKINLGFTVDDYECHSLCLILKNLNLSTIKLVSSDIKLTALIERIGINVTKRVPVIAFEYGK